MEYVNSDGQTLLLTNRDYWEVYDEEGEEVSEYCFQDSDVKEVEKSAKLKFKLIKFCIKHFDDYKPKINIY